MGTAKMGIPQENEGWEQGKGMWVAFGKPTDTLKMCME